MHRLMLLFSLPALLVAAEPSVHEMNLTTRDGFVLSGTLKVPEGRRKHPAVILVHPFLSDRKGWDPLVEKLNARGLATLAVDLRGHGSSTQQGGDSVTVASTYLMASVAMGYDQIPSDLAMAATWLRKQKGIDGRHLGLAGANEGAFAALLASDVIKPKATLALSPAGADNFGAGARNRMAAAATRAHATLMAFVASGDQEAEGNLAPLRPIFGANIRSFEGNQRGFDYLEGHGDVMAVFFAEYLLHPHTGRAVEKAKPAEGQAPATVLTTEVPANP